MDERIIIGVMLGAFATIAVVIMVWGIRGARRVVDSAPFTWECPLCGARVGSTDTAMARAAYQLHWRSHRMDAP